MTKQEEFLYIVQTTILANGINLATDSEDKEKYRHVYSGTGAFNAAMEALHASKTIPADLSASDAANDFCTFMLENFREQDEKSTGEKMVVPYWFARH